MASHPWFRPLHRRIGTVAACALWLGFEAWMGLGSVWFWFAIAVLIWAVWDLFLSGHYKGGEDGAG